MAKNKGVEVVEEAEETVEEAPVVEAADPTQTELKALREKAAEQDRKIAELEAGKPAAPAAQPQLTAAQIRAMGTDEAQREQIEKATGMKFDNYVAAVEQNENAQRETRLNGIEAKNNVRAALEDACAAEPQLTKLRAGINEFMDEFVSVGDKTDPKKLAKALAKAITYAKGKAHESGTVFAPKPAAGGKPLKNAKPGDSAPEFEEEGEDGSGPILESGEVKTGVHNLIGNGAGFKLNIEDRLPPAYADRPKAFKAETKHPDDPNGVRFGKDFDKAPKFS